MKEITTTILFVIAITINCFSQLNKLPITTYHVQQEGKSLTFSIVESKNQKSKKFNINKTYYWYKAQFVISTQGGSSGTLLNGNFNAYYLNKQLAEQGSFDRGLKNGIWKYWDDKGKLTRLETWKNGIIKGMQITFYSDGLIQKREIIGHLINKNLTGDTIVIITKLKKHVIINDKNGADITHMRFKNNQLHGKQETDSLGKKIVHFYKKGKLVTPKKLTLFSKKTKIKNSRLYQRVFKKTKP